MTAVVESAVQFQHVLRLADTSLILGQRLSEWCGHGPVIEEDIALTNVALDLIGQARLLLTHAGALEGRGRDEDQLAFLRVEPEYRNLTIVELPNGDFARTVLRNLLIAAWQREQWLALESSSDEQLTAIATKSLKETRYHLQHAADWTIRLGDGTAESHTRMQRALDLLWPYTAEFFATFDDDAGRVAADVGTAWPPLEARWNTTVMPVLQQATLKAPARGSFASTGTRGIHSEHLGHLLTGMQYLQRSVPGGTW